MSVSICQHCGKAFKVRPSRQKMGRGLFCSRDCYFDAKRRYAFAKKCEFCEKVFYTKNDDARYCSRLCAGKGAAQLVKEKAKEQALSEKKVRAHCAPSSFEDPWASGAIPPDYYGRDFCRMPDVWLGF